MAKSHTSPMVPDDGSGNAPTAWGTHSDMPIALGKYHITRLLGTGDRGEVWQAEDDLGNEVAIKLFGTSEAAGHGFPVNLSRESHTLLTLQHHNICRVYAVEEYKGRPYVVMEYVQGVDLARLLQFLTENPVVPQSDSRKLTLADVRAVINDIEERRRHRASTLQNPIHSSEGSTDDGRELPLQQVLSMVIKLCDAVQYAHESGVFHLRIKPSNIMVRPDGEPVLLDFGGDDGLREFGEPTSADSARSEAYEYAAPELCEGSERVDERADVYSVGAVLYEMVTGHRYFVSSGAPAEDRERLRNYQPVRPRAHSHQIDRELEAIILKAVASDREQRYRSVRSLEQDLERFRQGQPILANPPTRTYLLMKFIRRNALMVTLSSIIALLSFLLAGYYALDYYRHWGAWIPAFEQDFITRPYLSGQFEFVDTTGESGRSWVVDSGGLNLGRYDWCWLKGVRVSGNCRVVIRLRFDDMPDGFEIALNSASDPVDNWYNVPRGYTCQVGGYLGTLDFVSINNTPGTSRATNPVPSRFEHTEDVEVVFQREGERVTLFVNGHRQVEERDILPLWGDDFSRVGFRSFATSTHVRSIEIYRMSLPKKAGPLIAGDVLASLGYGRDAIRTYLGIANDYRASPLAEKALVRSMHAVYQLPEPYKSHLADSILGMYGVDIRRTPSWQDVREIQLLDMWKNGRYAKVLHGLPEHFEAYPASRIALELQNVGGGATIPDSVRRDLFMWAAQTRGVTCLNAHDVPADALEAAEGFETLGYLNWMAENLTSLAALTDTRLVWLQVANNRITDLSPLWGQPLRYLNCTGNTIADLAALTNAPLEVFNGDGNRLHDISALRYCPLKYLSIGENRVRDIAALEGKQTAYLFIQGNDLSDINVLEDMPLRILSCGFNRISSLAPLRRTPLRELRCKWNLLDDLIPLTGKALDVLDVSGNNIYSLQPLSRLPLRTLHCASNRIEDLSPLRGVHLRDLDVRNNRVTDLSPLSGMPLEVLDCSNNAITDFGPLRQMNLRVLRCGGNGPIPLPTIAALPLRELGCAGSGIVELWPLVGSHLQALDCSANRIDDLSPLVTLQLVSLDCSDNHIQSLEPLRFLPMTTLHCARNRIGSLEPLRGKPLQVLDCRDNPFESLAPLEQMPPQRFLFYTESLSAEECLRVASLWERDSASADLAVQARVLAAVNAQKWRDLRSQSTRIGGNDYLWIEWDVPRERAALIADSAGGHLLQIESDAEWLALNDSLSGLFTQTIWAGVSEQDGRVRWARQQGSKQTAPDGVVRHDKGAWVYHHGQLSKQRGAARKPFVIEWERSRGTMAGTG